MFDSTINPTIDQFWNEWLDLGHKGSSDLEALLTLDINNEFKFRALIVLLSHDLSNLPFRWDACGPLHLSLTKATAKNLPPDLIRFAGKLICENISLNKRNIEELNSLNEYNSLILQLLELLPGDDELAQSLFDIYPVSDLANYVDDNRYRYSRCCNIFYNDNIPTKWKILFDKKMQGIIINCTGSKEQLCREWELAFSCYVEYIRTYIENGNHKDYLDNLLISQIRFVIEVCDKVDYCKDLFDLHQLFQIMKIIPNTDPHKEIRYNFIRLVVLKSKVFISNTDNIEAVEIALAEFGSKDQELAEKLNDLLEEGKQEINRRTETLRNNKKMFDEVIGKMRY